MKQPWEYEEGDIDVLIRDGVQEAIDLDYKGSPALDSTDRSKNEVSKDVSAFANSAGGTIVYGVVENKRLPVRIDVGYDPSVITREWLEQVINSRIQRRIDGVRIKQVELRTSQPGKVIYVVSIPQSNRAPHQAADKRFYKRFNFESVPMEEYEVRDVARRLETPDLELELEMSDTPFDLSSGTPLGQVEIRAFLVNHSPVPAEYVVVRLIFVDRLKVPPQLSLDPQEKVQGEFEGRSWPATLLQIDWGVPTRMPVWAGARRQLTEVPITVIVPKYEPSQMNYFIGWRIDCPRTPTKRRYYNLHTDGSMIRLVPGPEAH